MSSRRQFLTVASAALASAWSTRLRAEPADVEASIAALFGERPIREGRVTLEVPSISENGYSVPLSVMVESPMTEADHESPLSIPFVDHAVCVSRHKWRPHVETRHDSIPYKKYNANRAGDLTRGRYGSGDPPLLR